MAAPGDSAEDGRERSQCRYNYPGLGYRKLGDQIAIKKICAKHTRLLNPEQFLPSPVPSPTPASASQLPHVFSTSICTEHRPRPQRRHITDRRLGIAVHGPEAVFIIRRGRAGPRERICKVCILGGQPIGVGESVFLVKRPRTRGSVGMGLDRDRRRNWGDGGGLRRHRVESTTLVSIHGGIGLKE